MWEKIKSSWVWIVGVAAVVAALLFQHKKIESLKLKDENNQNTEDNKVLETKIQDSNAALNEIKKQLEEEKNKPVSDEELLERLKKI